MTTRTRVRLGALATGALLAAGTWQPVPAAAAPRSISVKSVSADIADGVRDVAYSPASDTLWATVGTGDPVTSAALLALRPYELTTTASYPAPIRGRRSANRPDHRSWPPLPSTTAMTTSG